MKTLNSKLTIIVQGYNPNEKSLKKTIESLNLQNDKNFKVLFFDNGSKNGWMQFCKKYIDKNINWKYKRFKGKNSGIGFGRNLATKFVDTEYLCRVDDGDSITHDFVEIINKKISKGNDFIFFRHGKKFKKSRPTSYCLNKNIFVPYPEGTQFYVEDINSVLYYLITSKNPIIIDRQIYFFEDNSRWFNEKDLLNHVRNSIATTYWLNKVKSFNNFNTNININNFNFNKKSLEYISKYNRISEIIELRFAYESLPKKYFKELRQIYKKIKIKTLNPSYKLWPVIIYRFLSRK